jgi:glycosyltransferase involved in cell wall biosynthesis
VQRSLSVLFPVKNAQATLNVSVREILDVVADMDGPFELMIIDDGSADATSEVAHELARHFPQVRMVRHAKPLGHEAAIHTGLRRCRGDVVVVHEGAKGYRIVDRGHEPAHRASQAVRPTYLSRLKEFALGE